MNPIATAGIALPDAGRGRLTRGLYIALVMLMTIIVVLGFRRFYIALLSGGASAHWAIQLHAAVFSGWMLLLFTQAVLVYRGRIKAHRQLGTFGIYFGVAILAMGLVISFLAPALSVREGRSTLDEAASFLLLPLGDMLLFAGFFWAAIANRLRRDLHKRLILLATIALLFAPAARLGDAYGVPAVLAIWLSPLAIAMIHDAVTRRRVEPVYWIGLSILLLAAGRLALMDSSAWLGVGRSLLLPLIQ
jgi:ABC-type antimicrobial peptide transport system permease subunit